MRETAALRILSYGTKTGEPVIPKRSLMRTIGLHTRVASFVGAVALLMQISPALATGQDDHNRPVEITFTKWGVTAPPLPAPQPPFGLFEGFSGDRLRGLVRRRGSLATTEPERARQWTRGHVRGRGRGPFVHGAHPGRVECGGLGLLDGVILAGWRTGARVQVVFQRYLAIAGMPSCEGAPVNKTCFVGTIHVGRAPKD